MTQGIRIVKEGFDITTQDPRNVALDTRNPGGLKILPTIHVQLKPQNYTDKYTVNLGTFSNTFNRIRIPHDFGFSPGFRAWVQFTNNGNYTTAGLPYLGLGQGALLEVESNDKEVLITGIPDSLFDETWVTLTIIVENLDAQVV